MNTFRLSTALTAAVLAGSASAQNFNIDVSDLMSFPANTYGAASGQVGTWNVLVGGPPYASNLVDLTGGPTTVTTNVTAVGNGTGDFSFNNASTTNNDEFLMDDCQDIGNGASPSSTVWTFSGLNPVNYDIYVYAWAPDSATFVSTVSECGSGTSFMSGGAWPGGFVEGVTHVRLDACATGGSLQICVDSGGVTGNFSSVNGYQFIESGGSCEAGNAICFGDGTGANCGCGNNGASNTGCGNNGASNTGCRNSTGSGGILAGAGTASLSGDTLELTATQIPNSPGLTFQGNLALANPSTFGDGIRCCGQGVVRWITINAQGNCASTNQPAGCGTQVGGLGGPISQHPMNAGLMPGDSRCYQHWYRDPGANNPCQSDFFNLTNGYVVIWGA